ncbi:MAG: SGNH/GDSL hydrolase family protein [Deltaproteobacteria bacterium]|nr:SGNH/GDSL hydrolase family protein [Deltaproteobacteria bacterium]
MNRQLFRHHDTIGHLFVPGIKARVEHEAGGYLLRTNREGFRCRHAFEKKRAPGKFRVLLFGDSYTAGDGVSDRFRYGDVLETLIPGLEVYNFGLSGSGTDQQYLIWREMAREIEHDLVVIGVLVENIRRIVARYRPYETPDGKPVLLAKPYFTLERSGDLSLHNVPVPREPLTESELAGDGAAHVDRGGRFEGLRRLVAKLGPDVKERLQRWTRYQPLPAYDRPNDPDWLLMKAILTRWTSELPGPAVICPIPLYQYIEETASPKGYQARFRELDAPPRVRIHDPLGDFQQVSRAERRTYRFEVDCHLTPSAHEVLARSLARTIEPLMAKSS